MKVKVFESNALTQASKLAQADMKLYSSVRTDAYTQALERVRLMPVQNRQDNKPAKGSSGKI